MELGTQCLKQAYARDPFHVWTVNTLKLLDSLETDYVSVPSSHFNFKFHQDEKDTLPQFAVPLAERAYKEMSTRYGFEPHTPILLEVYPRHKDFSVRTFGLPGLGALGVCFGRVVAIDSPRAQEAMGPFAWGAIMWHELAHVFHLQLTDFRVPRWFTEGLATYEEQLGSKGWEREKQLQILDAYQNGLLVSIDSIDRGLTGPAGDLTIYYLYGSLICEYIDKNFGFAKILEMLNMWKGSARTQDVVKCALGISTSELDFRMRQFIEEWLKDVKVRRPVNPMLLAALEARMAQEPENSGLAAQVVDILISQNKIARAEELVMRTLERDPVSVDCAIVAARLFGEKTRPDRAREFLMRAAALGVDDLHTHFSLGQVYLAEGKREAAIDHFEAAKKALPGGVVANANPYLALADIYTRAGEEEKEIKELEALAAIDNVDFKIRMRLAKLYRKRDKVQDVVRILGEAALVEVRDIEMQAYLGEALRDLDRHEEAVVAFRATVVLLETVNKDGKKNMLISDYYCNLAESCIALNQREKALEAAKEARLRSPQNERAHELIRKLAD
jgi:tetratricopeptide (TPR) repeat protein